MASVHPYVEARVQFGRAMLSWMRSHPESRYVRVKVFAKATGIDVQYVVAFSAEAKLRRKYLVSKDKKKALAVELQPIKVREWMSKGFPIPQAQRAVKQPRVKTIEELHDKGLLKENLRVAKWLLENCNDGGVYPTRWLGENLGMPDIVTEATCGSFPLDMWHFTGVTRTRGILIDHSIVRNWVRELKEYREEVRDGRGG